MKQTNYRKKIVSRRKSGKKKKKKTEVNKNDIDNFFSGSNIQIDCLVLQHALGQKY